MENAIVGKMQLEHLFVTVDDETIHHGMVTIRDRDTMEQISLPIEEVDKYIMDQIRF